MKYPQSAFPEIFSHTVNNETDVLHSTKCSCLFCRQTYDARKINDWVNDKNGVTALCPECGMDAVVGDASGFVLDHDTLKALNLAYFGEDYMEKHPDAAQKYIKRYQEGKITHKKENEALYIQYLSLLATSHFSDEAAYQLGILYQYGTSLTTKDPKAALSWFSSESLKNDGDALTHIGLLLESGELGKAAPALAYQCYAKAMALGYANGLFHFSDCYRDGHYVAKDIDFASQVLSNTMPEVYNRFSASLPFNSVPYGRAAELGSLSYRIGRLFEIGSPKVAPNLFEAVHYYLLAQFAFSSIPSETPMTGDIAAESADTNQRLTILAKLNGQERRDPQFDTDTFSDTITFFLYDPEEGAYHLPSPCLFHASFHDTETQRFAFEIMAPQPMIVCDVDDLFISPIRGRIRWYFEDVDDVEIGDPDNKPAQFDTIIGDSEKGYQLIDTRGKDAPHTVAVIHLLPPKGQPEEEKDEPDSLEVDKTIAEENRKKA